MLILRRLRLQKASTGTAQRRRQWEERVAGLLAIQEQKAANNAANRFDEKYQKKQYTPIQKAFPELESSTFAAMAKRRAAADSPPNAKVHVAAVVGPANAGKSSLVNALTHRLYSAEGRGAGTTTGTIRALTTVGSSQIVLLDTPGLTPPKASPRMQHTRDLSTTVWDSLQAADSVLACVPVHNNGFLDADHRHVLLHIARRATAREMPIDLCITMMDRVTTPKLRDYYFAMRSEIEGLGIPIRKSFETSTIKSQGLIEIKDYFASIGKSKAWEAEERGRDNIAAALEIVKQSFINHLPKPIPDEASTHVVGWTKRQNGTIDIFVEVFFGRPAQMSTFLSRIAGIAAECNQVGMREFEKTVHFSFQAFVSEAGVSGNK